MENKKSTSKPNIEYGVTYGILMILSFILIYALGVSPIEKPMIGRISSLSSYFLFPIIFIYLGITTHKKNNFGFVSISECLKTGVSIVFIAALLFAVFSVVFNLIFPEFIDQILVQTRQVMLKQNPNLTSEQVEMALSITKKFSSPIFSVPVTLLMFSFLGLIYSLIIGLILKKDKPQFD